MTPKTGEAIIVLGLFVLPGFVTLMFRERLFTSRTPNGTLDRLLQALFYSALIYLIALGVAALCGLDSKDLVQFWNSPVPSDSLIVSV